MCSVFFVTNDKRLCSTFCTVEANCWQTRSIARPLFDSRATCIFMTSWTLWQSGSLCYYAYRCTHVKVSKEGACKCSLINQSLRCDSGGSRFFEGGQTRVLRAATLARPEEPKRRVWGRISLQRARGSSTGHWTALLGHWCTTVAEAYENNLVTT